MSWMFYGRQKLIGQRGGIRLLTLERAISGGFPRPGQGDSGRRLYSFQVKSKLSTAFFLLCPSTFRFVLTFNERLSEEM
jgi:hypothetical protein